jgi:hypothetical protein
MTFEVSTTDKRDGKALALFASWHLWQQGHTTEGRPFFGIPGMDRMAVLPSLPAASAIVDAASRTAAT